MTEEIEREWKQATSRVRSHSIPASYRKVPKTECPNCGEYQFQEWRIEKTEEVYALKLFGFKFLKTERVVEEEYETHAECSNCQYYTEEIEE